MAQDDIVQRIVVEGADQAVSAFALIEKGATQALGGIAQMAQALVGSLGPAGIAIGALSGALGGFVAVLQGVVEHASEAAAGIRGLAIISGTSVENMSALVSAFSAAGVGTEGLVTNFRRLSQTVLTELPKVREEIKATGDTIASAELKSKEAVNALNKVRGESLSYNEHDIAVKKAQIAVSEALRAEELARANDVRRFVQYFDDLAKGVKTSTEGMNMSLENLRKGLVGSLGGAGEALKDFTGSLTQIDDPNVEKMLLKMADIFHNMPDGIQKTALAVQIFGRSAGPGLIAFMNQGSEAILKQKQHYADLGLVITDVEQGALKRFRIANYELTDVLDRIKEKLAAAIAPVFTERLEQVRHFLESHMALWKSVGEVAKSALEGTFGLVDKLGNDLKFLSGLIDKVSQGWQHMFAVVRASDAKSVIDPWLIGFQFMINALNSVIALLATMFGNLTLQSQKTIQDWRASVMGIPEASRKAFDELDRQFQAGKIGWGDYLRQVTDLQRAIGKTGETAKDSGAKTKEAYDAAVKVAEDARLEWIKNGGSLDDYKQKLTEAQKLAVTPTKIPDPTTDATKGVEQYKGKLDEVKTKTAEIAQPKIDWSLVVNATNDAVTQITQAFSSTNFFGSLTVQIDTLIQKFWQLAQAAKDAAAATAQASSGGGGDSLPMASGGYISGAGSATSDSIWARLSNGEFVMRAAAVQTYGVGLMQAINSLQAPRFAAGGMLSPRQSPVLSPSMTGQRVLHLSIEGRSFTGMSVPEHTAQSLERFAVHSQIASTGRKQSWRR